MTMLNTNKTKPDTDSTPDRSGLGTQLRNRGACPANVLFSVTEPRGEMGCPPPLLATATHSSQLSAQPVEGR